MLESELASGRVQADRAPAYRRVLDKIESVDSAEARGEITPEAANEQTQALIADFMRYVADPGTASLHASPAAREVLRYAGGLKTAILRLIKDSPPPATSEAVAGISGDVNEAMTSAAKASDTAKLAAIEADLLRKAARNWHDLLLTRHAVLARPLWESNEVTRTENTLFYSGAKDLQTTLERVAASKLLSVDDTRRLQNHGQLRWDALNACHVAVFDLRLAADVKGVAARSPKQARELTGTAYELGLAFALGKPVVLLSDPNAPLPFDIDLSPVPIDGTPDDEDVIAQAVDEAFYVAQRESRGNAIPDSLKELDRLTRDHPRRASIEGMGWLDPSLKKDPAGFAAAVRQVLREVDDPQRQLLRPAWPGAYPQTTQPRCFHVMPFRPAWADEVRDTARAVCKDLGLIYRRGDEAEEGRIIQAVWDDLCRASVVLVELHGGNLNVMIELGIAHALGRPVLAVQRNGAQDLRPRHIEKLRVHSYNTTDELATLLKSRLKA
jgi:nucleoside 2-deoxyribosyltransferase